MTDTPDPVDLVSRIDPDRPESAFEVGQQLGDEFAQMLDRFVHVRAVPVIAHLRDTYGTEVAQTAIAGLADLIRAAADSMAPPSEES